MNRSDTIAAPATPPGVSALAVIRVSGPEALSITGKVFRGSTKDWESAKGYTAHFGRFSDLEGNLLDEVVATVFRSPRSFTGEDAVEFSFHGSEYIRKRAMEILVEAGCRVADPGEFTLRAFLNGKMDLSQAEAVADLIASDAAGSHRLAIEQMRGGYMIKLKELRERLVNLASLLELELDFSEEDVEFADRTQLYKLLEDMISELKRLSDSFASGNVIREGIPVAIIGKPNAGKSTLLNHILGEERAIVSEIAGTTRDTVEEELILNGTRFRFIDTAGLRETGDTIESIGVSRSHEKARIAHVIIYLFDPGDTDPSELETAMKGLEKIKAGQAYTVIPVANKSDLYPHLLLTQNYGHIPGILFISARNDRHLDKLLGALSSYASALSQSSGDVMVSNVRHKEAFDKALRALQLTEEGIRQKLTTDLLAVHLRSAINYLGEITGQVTSDEILGNIFSRFCIGK